jgi:hypothetical protein
MRQTMSKNNKDHDIFEKEQRHKLFPYLIALFVIAYLINTGLWALDMLAILTFIIIFVVSKLIMVIFRFINYKNWRSRRYSFLLPFLFILIIAFLFDFQSIRDLWIYRSIAEIQGHVIKFIKTKAVSVVYEYSVDGVSFQGQQEVSNSYYENLRQGSQVSIKYNPDHPSYSFLVDTQHLKGQTGATLLLGFGLIVAMFANELQEKINSFLNNYFRAKKPA